MKKTILTIAIILGITLGGIAQEKGLFGRAPQEGFGYSLSNRDPEPDPAQDFGLPFEHGMTEDQNVPLTGGTLLLLGLGAAYALKKQKKH